MERQSLLNISIIKIDQLCLYANRESLFQQKKNQFAVCTKTVFERNHSGTYVAPFTIDSSLILFKRFIAS